MGFVAIGCFFCLRFLLLDHGELQMTDGRMCCQPASGLTRLNLRLLEGLWMSIIIPIKQKLSSVWLSLSLSEVQQLLRPITVLQASVHDDEGCAIESTDTATTAVRQSHYIGHLCAS